MGNKIIEALISFITTHGMTGFIAVGAVVLIYYVLKQQEKREQRDAEREKSLVRLLEGQKEALNKHTDNQREMFQEQKVSNGHNRDEHSKLMRMGEKIFEKCMSHT